MEVDGLLHSPKRAILREVNFLRPISGNEEIRRCIFVGKSKHAAAHPKTASVTAGQVLRRAKDNRRFDLEITNKIMVRAEGGKVDVVQTKDLKTSCDGDTRPLLQPCVSA